MEILRSFSWPANSFPAAEITITLTDPCVGKCNRPYGDKLK
jgi:hypothetical protein